jgi:hypothetical protein
MEGAGGVSGCARTRGEGRFPMRGIKPGVISILAIGLLVSAFK